MKIEAILFLLSIHEGNELRDQLPGSAYDELAAAGLLDGTEITDKGYAYVRLLCDVPEPVQTWVDPRSFAGDDAAYAQKVAVLRRARKVAESGAEIVAAMVKGSPLPTADKIREAEDAPREVLGNAEDSILVSPVPPGYQPSPGQIPGGVDRAADVQIVRANGKRKTLPAQAINWADNKTPDRVIGWRYAAAPGEGRIHTPGETMPAPDA